MDFAVNFTNEITDYAQVRFIALRLRSFFLGVREYPLEVRHFLLGVRIFALEVRHFLLEVRHFLHEVRHFPINIRYVFCQLITTAAMKPILGFLIATDCC